jgi:hypothetical protein
MFPECDQSGERKGTLLEYNKRAKPFVFSPALFIVPEEEEQKAKEEGEEEDEARVKAKDDEERLLATRLLEDY